MKKTIWTLKIEGKKIEISKEIFDFIKKQSAEIKTLKTENETLKTENETLKKK